MSACRSLIAANTSGNPRLPRPVLDHFGHLAVGLGRVGFAVEPELAQYRRKLGSREFLSLLGQIGQVFGNRVATPGSWQCRLVSWSNRARITVRNPPSAC